MAECENCAFPSKKQMLRNLAFSFVNVVGEAFKTGKALADKGTIKARMEICDACEFKKDTRCTECGCYLTYKVGLNSEKCPKGYW